MRMRKKQMMRRWSRPASPVYNASSLGITMSLIGMLRQIIYHSSNQSHINLKAASAGIK